MEPEIVWSAPSRVTVPPLASHVGAPDLVKFFSILNAPAADGAVKVPPERVKSPPFTSTIPLAPVKVPLETVSPALNVWVPFLVRYVPPFTVARPVTVFV